MFGLGMPELFIILLIVLVVVIGIFSVIGIFALVNRTKQGDQYKLKSEVKLPNKQESSALAQGSSSVIFCSACGQKNEGGANFCLK